jgi:hypothetical protein
VTWQRDGFSGVLALHPLLPFLWKIYVLSGSIAQVLQLYDKFLQNWNTDSLTLDSDSLTLDSHSPTWQVGESFFDYVYHREFETKIGTALNLAQVIYYEQISAKPPENPPLPCPFNMCNY